MISYSSGFEALFETSEPSW